MAKRFYNRKKGMGRKKAYRKKVSPKRKFTRGKAAWPYWRKKTAFAWRRVRV